jgi:uncharacterized surface protein with fasciclin (FAS1) repeats
MILIIIAPSVAQKNIVNMIARDGRFKKLVQLLTDLDLIKSIKYQDAVTIFAPSDEAFKNWL